MIKGKPMTELEVRRRFLQELTPAILKTLRRMREKRLRGKRVGMGLGEIDENIAWAEDILAGAAEMEAALARIDEIMRKSADRPDLLADADALRAKVLAWLGRDDSRA
jgi:hypothetical protein